MVEKEAFVYCWTDHKTNKLYVGSHKGSTNDGYICSSKIMKEQYNERPDVSIKNKKGLSIESRKKISKNHKDVSGSNNPLYGKKHTEESKQKMSKAQKGKLKGHKASLETKQKMSIARKLYWERRRNKNLGN
jgi:hypothetical protein